MWARKIFVVLILYPIYFFFRSLMYSSSTFSMIRSLSFASVFSDGVVEKFPFTNSGEILALKVWCLSVDVWIHARGIDRFVGCCCCDAGDCSEFGVIDDEGKVSVFPPPSLLGLHCSRFDGKFVDEEGVWDEGWFDVHPIDWLAVEVGCDVVGDAFTEGVRNFAVVDAIIDIRLGSSY